MFSFLQTDDPGAPGVGVAFTDRRDGFSTGPFTSLNLGRSDVDDPRTVLSNLTAVADRLGLGDIVTVHQVHGANVVAVDEAMLATWTADSPAGESVGATPLIQADALVTTLRRADPVALCVRVADCVPVLLADPGAGVVGAAHAGRVGFLGGVLPAVVDAMRARGADRIQAWIGPHICGACYEVPEAMRDEVARDHPAAVATTSWGTPSLDLGAGCAAQLEGLDVTVARVDPCTREDPDLYSHRRDGDGAGRLGALVWLLP